METHRGKCGNLTIFSSVLAPFSNIYRNKKVFLTGHTGFKGSWLAEWLLLLGAEVYGYALEPSSLTSLFHQLGLASRLHHHIADIRDPSLLEKSLLSFQPDFIFHLAAQPLVRYSYAQPRETYETNVMGTIHLLEALRKLQHLHHSSRVPIAAVMITTDKVYRNHGHGICFHEEDSLGGHDPYSSSKAMAEIAIEAYRHSYFKTNSLVRIASARAGNVIGGGDDAEDRIVPDCVRALQKGESIPLRHPRSIRPWQHVLEPLGAYLWLGARLMKEPSLAQAFNFGPNPKENYQVLDLVLEFLKYWPGDWKDVSDPHAVYEAPLLHLSIDKAVALLGWQPLWTFQETIAQTASWYRSHHEQDRSDAEMTQHQIASYLTAAKKANAPWAS
jgi:CDP-glucose 4,6-dehydratase